MLNELRYIDLLFLVAALGMIAAGEIVPALHYLNPISDGSVLRCSANAQRLTDPRGDWLSDCWIDERPTKI